MTFTDFSPTAKIFVPVEEQVAFAYSVWGEEGNGKKVCTVDIVPDTAATRLVLDVPESDFADGVYGGPMLGLLHNAVAAGMRAQEWFNSSRRERAMLPATSIQDVHCFFLLLDQGMRAQHRVDIVLCDLVSASKYSTPYNVLHSESVSCAQVEDAIDAFTEDGAKQTRRPAASTEDYDDDDDGGGGVGGSAPPPATLPRGRRAPAAGRGSGSGAPRGGGGGASSRASAHRDDGGGATLDFGAASGDET